MSSKQRPSFEDAIEYFVRFRSRYPVDTTVSGGDRRDTTILRLHTAMLSDPNGDPPTIPISADTFHLLCSWIPNLAVGRTKEKLETSLGYLAGCLRFIDADSEQGVDSDIDIELDLKGDITDEDDGDNDETWDDCDVEPGEVESGGDEDAQEVECAVDDDEIIRNPQESADAVSNSDDCIGEPCLYCREHSLTCRYPKKDLDPKIKFVGSKKLRCRTCIKRQKPCLYRNDLYGELVKMKGGTPPVGMERVPIPTDDLTSPVATPFPVTPSVVAGAPKVAGERVLRSSRAAQKRKAPDVSPPKASSSSMLLVESQIQTLPLKEVVKPRAKRANTTEEFSGVLYMVKEDGGLASMPTPFTVKPLSPVAGSSQSVVGSSQLLSTLETQVLQAVAHGKRLGKQMKKVRTAVEGLEKEIDAFNVFTDDLNKKFNAAKGY
ncbi:hypothetical protein CPC08DRAFT_770158 [Agrocybe pediades]|nr:hypothetical protein CPC08DRAFT_770158 [Agrocybe pediades]